MLWPAAAMRCTCVQRCVEIIVSAATPGHKFASLDGQDSLAEWSKALAQGASPQGRGFEPHSCHFLLEQPDVQCVMSARGGKQKAFAS